MIRSSRREFIQNVLRAAPAAALLSSPLARAWAEMAPLQNRPIPNLSEDNILRFTAGLRPYRRNGLRIERENRFGKILVHNYGHSGAGITLAWGSAEAAVDLIHGESKLHHVAVLGGGVIGLSTAHELRARGYTVTIYSEKWHPDITSSVAGGQWSPALVGQTDSPSEKARYQKILEASFKKYQAFAGAKYGVSLKDNILAEGSDDQLLKIKIPAMPPHYHVHKLPFDGVNIGGDIYRSWLIEPTIYLPALTERLRRQDVRFITQVFNMDDRDGNTSADVSHLNEPIVFNCLGLGAKKLVVDDNLMPIRGRLIHLNPDPRLDYLLLHDGYMFSRSDAIILGGTYDRGQSDMSFDEAQYATILKTHRDFFGINQPVELSRVNVPYLPNIG